MSAGPGWYPDPEMAGTNRYWDGGQWTEHRAPSTYATAVQAQQKSMGAGYALAILFPIGGFIYGLFNLRQGGEKVIAVSILVFVITLALVSAV